MLAVAAVAALAASASAAFLNATDIQGPSFSSPYTNQSVNVTGIVSAKGSQGWYIQSGPTSDIRVSSGLKVFTTSTTVQAQVNVGDLITLTGKIQEYRSDPTYLFVTELSSPTNIVVVSSNNTVAPVVLGQDRSPPTQKYTALDQPGFLGVPNNSSRIEVVNATLQPEKYGLDFWESLEGMLVTIRKPVALNFENQYGEFWVRGDYPVTGLNARGGLTMTRTADGDVDMASEAIIIGKPLDGTKNTPTWVGTEYTDDITGVIEYTFGFYYLLPLTAPVISNAANTTLPITSIEKSTDPCILTAGDYNVENMSAGSAHIPTVASHIVNNLKSPEILFLQEIQDDDGATDSGNVDASGTLQKLVDAIKTASNGTVVYDFIEVLPENDKDGGQPGGNIRPAYIYLSSLVTLVNGTVGGPLDANSPLLDSDNLINLKFNPGRVDPTNEAAWSASRKPIAAVWEKKGKAGQRFITINLHDTSKGGSSSEHGDARPPVNGGVDQREAQVEAIATFAKSIYAVDKDASVIVSGDWNEFIAADYVFKQLEGLLTEVDDVAKVPAVERYTYVFNANTQQLDHVFVSPAVAARGLKAEHIHVNTHAVSYKSRISDHDPSVVQVNICKATPPPTSEACAYKIDTYCASPLPAFTDAKSCVTSVGVCFKESLECFTQVPLAKTTECLKFQALCAKNSLTCAKCLVPGSKCDTFA
ncbi:DNase I-like protein [Auriculariales sp. MPI-PUGE-AT-0066]|nr:DNase I-like protein [Auriculariales sp. MPI-PUGE-AT-0066]